MALFASQRHRYWLTEILWPSRQDGARGPYLDLKTLVHMGARIVNLLKKRFLEDLLSYYGRIFYHLAVATLSGAIALSLPWGVSFIAKHFLIYWAIIKNEKLFVISIEMAVAVLLILFFNSVGRNWKDRKLSNMARKVGLVFASPAKGLLARRRTKKWKEKQAFAKDIMVIDSTGFHTMVDSKGDLHHVIQNCREGKIMLLNPFSQRTNARTRSLPAPSVTPERFREQIRKGILFLKDLKAAKKNIKLKLYDESPLFRLAILDDHIWIQHYHIGLDIKVMPEYVFKHDQNLGSLYNPFYQYFLIKWNHPDIPEYDLENDELIYRDRDGNEVWREKFGMSDRELTMEAGPSHDLISKNGNFLERNIHFPQRNHKDRACIEDPLKRIW